MNQLGNLSKRKKKKQTNLGLTIKQKEDDMAGNVRKVLKSITDQINKSPVLCNTSSVINNTFDLAQEKISHLQTITSDKYVNITKVYTNFITHKNFIYSIIAVKKFHNQKIYLGFQKQCFSASHSFTKEISQLLAVVSTINRTR